MAVVYILLRSRTVGRGRVTAARETREILCSLSNVLSRRRRCSVLPIAVTAVRVIVSGRCGGGRVGYVITVGALNVIITSLIIRVIVRLVIGARLQSGRQRKLSVAVTLIILVVISRLGGCALHEITVALLIIIILIIRVVDGRLGRRTGTLEIIIVLIVGGRFVRGRRYVVTLSVLISVVILLRSRTGRRDETVGSLIVIVPTVEAGVGVLITDRRWRRRARRNVVILVQLLLSTNFPHSGLLFRLLDNLVLVGLVVLVIVLFTVPVVKIAGIAAA